RPGGAPVIDRLRRNAVRHRLMTGDDRAQQSVHPVQMQLEAYNMKDIDEFMRWWAADCEYFAFPDQLLARGAAAIRERHIARFAEPDP
ncbi:hypothetical protein NP569_25535, partial [Vibrio parahaemolyticus]|nr:hypothetical protein [Vibrio parahaemolyticus]